MLVLNKFNEFSVLGNGGTLSFKCLFNKWDATHLKEKVKFLFTYSCFYVFSLLDLEV